MYLEFYISLGGEFTLNYNHLSDIFSHIHYTDFIVYTFDFDSRDFISFTLFRNSFRDNYLHNCKHERFYCIALSYPSYYRCSIKCFAVDYKLYLIIICRFTLHLFQSQTNGQNVDQFHYKAEHERGENVLKIYKKITIIFGCI